MNNDKYNEISRFAAVDKRRRKAIDRGDVAAAMESAAQMEEAGAALTEKQDPVYSISSCAIPPNPNAELEELTAQLREEIRQGRQEAKEDNQQTRQEAVKESQAARKRSRIDHVLSIIAILIALISLLTKR